MATPDLIQLLKLHTPGPGTYDTHLPGLKLVHASAPMARTSMLYDACVCFVAQGRKRVYLMGRMYQYDPMRYLVVSLPLPVEAEIVLASPEEPLLVLVLQVDLAEVGQLLLEMDLADAAVEPHPRPGLFVSAVHEELSDAITRLVAVATDRIRARVLGPGVMREVLFHLLRGDQSEQLRQLALNGGAGRGVARAVRYLQKNFNKPTNVDNLARLVGMSASTLHRNFKEATSLTPIQYLKKVRLHRARVLMMSDGLNVGEAAYRVGYHSQSQFSREFKRLFGATPTQALRDIRTEHAPQPAL